MKMQFIKLQTLLLTLVWVSWSNQMECKENSTMCATEPMRESDGSYQLADAINDFGFSLTKKLMEQKAHKNVVISPTGIAGLLAMTLLGSAGKTYEELANILGFSQDILFNRKNHDHLGGLLQQLNTNSTGSATMFADAIFVDVHTRIREVYRSYLKQVYKGDTIPATFQQQSESKQLINDWVKNHTNGKIEEFLKAPLPATTKVVLLTALYFSGQWANPFMIEHTSKMLFKTPSRDVMADLMLNAGDFTYMKSAKDGLHIVALPYNDSTTTMYVLKPLHPMRRSLSNLMESLDYKKINDHINTMKRHQCVIRFPKLELNNEINLKQSLEALGLSSVFSPIEANFALMVYGTVAANPTEDELITRINSGEVEQRGLKERVNSLPNPGVYVDSVLHDVKITINEYGTEAVAATSGVLARSAELFYANSPFYMFIRNEVTKLITFSAVIFDPTNGEITAIPDETNVM